MRPDQPLLDVQGVTLRTARGATIVDDVSFQLPAGGFTAIVGESGSGKTMLARGIIGLLPQGIYQAAGAISLMGENLSTMPKRRLRQLRGPGMGMVFQEPMVSLNPAMTIGRQMAEGPALHSKASAAEIRAQCEHWLGRVGIDDTARCLAAYPHEFSGGMRQRILLASVMMLQPRLLIADEPTTALDNLTQRDVLERMRALAAETGTAVLLITHNLGLVARYAREVVVMCRGRLVEAGDVEQVLRQPQQEYTRRLVDAMPSRRRDAVVTRPGPTAQPLLSVQALSVRYAGRRGAGKQAVSEAGFEIREGETVALVGGSGSGKTTLGRAAIGLVPAAGGTIRFRGRALHDLDAAGRAAFRHDCQIVFQDPFSSLSPRERVGRIVAEPLRHQRDLSAAERARRTGAMLDEVGLSGLDQRFPHELSGGQRQRVAIARALIRNPPFLVADEPVSALDMTVQKQVLALLYRLQQSHGFACLFITHDLAAVEQIADRILVMQDGRIVESGDRDDVLDRPQHPYTQALVDAAPGLV